MSKKNAVVITGGLGYIGLSIAAQLIDEGNHVIIIDDQSNSKESDALLLGPARIQNVYLIKCHLSPVTVGSLTLAHLTEEFNIDTIVHCAADKSVDESMENPIQYYYNNLNSLMGSFVLMENYGIKNILFSSSASVYGSIEDESVVEGDAIYTDRPCAYSTTKWLGEQMLENYCKIKGFNGVNLRYFNPIGKTVKQDTTDSLMGILVRTRETGTINIFGTDYDTKDGTCLRDFIDMRDLVSSHISVINAWRAGFNEYAIFNVGTGVATTVREIVEEFKSQCGWPITVVDADRRLGDTQGSTANCAKIKNFIGWSAQYNISLSIKNLLENLNPNS